MRSTSATARRIYAGCGILLLAGSAAAQTYALRALVRNTCIQSCYISVCPDLTESCVCDRVRLMDAGAPGCAVARCGAALGAAAFSELGRECMARASTEDLINMPGAGVGTQTSTRTTASVATSTPVTAPTTPMAAPTTPVATPTTSSARISRPLPTQVDSDPEVEEDGVFTDGDDSGDSDDSDDSDEEDDEEDDEDEPTAETPTAPGNTAAESMTFTGDRASAPTPPATDDGAEKERTISASTIAIAVTIPLVFLSLLAGGFFFARRRRQRQQRLSINTFMDKSAAYEPNISGPTNVMDQIPPSPPPNMSFSFPKPPGAQASPARMFPTVYEESTSSHRGSDPFGDKNLPATPTPTPLPPAGPLEKRNSPIIRVPAPAAGSPRHTSSESVLELQVAYNEVQSELASLNSATGTGFGPQVDRTTKTTPKRAAF